MYLYIKVSDPVNARNKDKTELTGIIEQTSFLKYHIWAEDKTSIWTHRDNDDIIINMMIKIMLGGVEMEVIEQEQRYVKYLHCFCLSTLRYTL